MCSFTKLIVKDDVINCFKFQISGSNKMSLSNLLSAIKSQNVQKRQEALLQLRKRSKSVDDVTHLYDLECGDTLLDLLEEENGKYYIVVLSIFANCTNINENWRQLVSFIDS